MPNVDWTNKNTLQNLINTIHARLITKIAHYAVMPTANNKLLGEIAQYIGTTDANFVNAYFYKCYEVVDEDTGAISYSWKPVDVQASTAISTENDNALVELSDGFYVKAVQMTALPVATADNLGVIYQYVGTTNVSFINGYFYKNEAVTDETTGDVTYEWHNVKTQDATAISEVVDNAIVDLADGIYVKAVQLVTLPEATVDNVGVIYQYIGNSTATLTNGYFYKNIATTDEDTGETTYAWTAFATQEEAVKHWIGTRAELEVALENDEIEDGTVILITDEPEIDELPTEDSTNLVYSGGVWTALQEKENVFRYTTMPTAGEELEGEIVEYIGATTLDYTNGYFYKCVSDGGDPAVYSWENIPVQDMGEKIQYEVLPTPTADNLGQIAEYIGATNAEYTNGFFYEVAEVAESDPAEYEWVQKNVQPEGLKASGHPVNNTSDRPDWHSGVADENWEGYFSKPTVDVVAISESEVGEYDTGYVYVVEDPTLSTHSTFVWEIVYISNGDIRKYYKSTNLVTVNKVSITQELYNAIPAAKLDVDWTWWVTDTNTVYYRGKTFSGLRASGYPINNIEDKPDWHSGIAEESWEGYYSKPTIDATAVLSTELDSHKGEYVYVVKEPTDTDLPTLWWEIVYISGNESYQPGNKYKCTSLAKVNKVSITKELYDMIPSEKLDVDWTWWITDKSTIMLDGVEYGGDTIQVVSLPTATADNLGKIVQYIGENDTVNNLVKGFFYRCAEVPDTDPTEYEWVNQEVQESTDGEAKVNATAVTSLTGLADGFYLLIDSTATPIYQLKEIADGTATDSDKEVDTCLIDYVLYNDNKTVLDTLDIVWVVTGTPDISDYKTEFETAKSGIRSNADYTFGWDSDVLSVGDFADLKSQWDDFAVFMHNNKGRLAMITIDQYDFGFSDDDTGESSPTLICIIPELASTNEDYSIRIPYGSATNMHSDGYGSGFIDINWRLTVSSGKCDFAGINTILFKGTNSMSTGYAYIGSSASSVRINEEEYSMNDDTERATAYGLYHQGVSIIVKLL